MLSPPQDLYEPPHPKPLPALPSLLRVMMSGEGNLLALLPREAYRVKTGWIGYSRRSILIVNDPELVRGVLTDPLDVYPKSDLMTGALEPLVGDSVFVSAGDVWRRQRAMIEPAFGHMHLGRAFEAMTAAVDAVEARLDRAAAEGPVLSLDLLMSQLTADVVCRTVFSTPLDDAVAREVFEAFTRFERSVTHVEIKRLIFDRPWAKTPQPAGVLAACEAIRRHLASLLDAHEGGEDIAASVMAARDGAGRGFTREELIDQLGVFFLAGHETTASALTWAFFVLSQRPELLTRLRAETDAADLTGAGAFEAVKRLSFTKAVFKEAMRLYPPITFIPRVAAETARIGPHKVRRGAMIMIAPWTIHRHEALWENPHHFDPDRFIGAREKAIPHGAYLPFGLGPRVCVGAAFAQIESALILARLLSRYEFELINGADAWPVARLTTRPRRELQVRLRRRGA